MRFGFAGRLWAAASLLFVVSCSTGLLPPLSSALSSALADEVGSYAVDPATGFVPLFNGRDFTGWRFSDASALPKTPPAAWRIESGAIVCAGGGGAGGGGAGGGGAGGGGAGGGGTILASQWEYADFELVFEWRAASEDFDADFYLHAGRMLEADPIRIAKGREGGPQENDRGEGQYNAGPGGLIGGGGNNRKAVPDLQKPVGQWNEWRIVAEGSRLSLSCNGKEAWRCEDHVPRTGYLGFRVFKGPIEFRNLRIRESGFRHLMDLSEWEVYPGFGGRGAMADHWKRDGLHWTFQGAGPSIVTKDKTYRSYLLRVEFLFADPNPSDTNTGVYLRGVHPWQADIWEHKWGSGLWGLLHKYVPAQRNIQDLGKAVRPTVRMDNPQGHWNYLEIRLEDNVVSTWLNGRATVDRYPIPQVDPHFPAAGGIGMQAHWPWKEVRFHNIRVKRLGAAESPKTSVE
jgi:hypothetical protein